MPRSFDAYQAQALRATDRSTYVRVWSEGPSGTLQNMSTLLGEDFFDSVVIDADVDRPISQATFTFGRKVGTLSLVPLDENSPINRDASGTYAPFLHPYRDMRVDVCTLASGARPLESDWVQLWEGISDSVDWGGNGPIKVMARDPMARLNDTFIETVATYGNDSGTKSLETTIQEILTANISSPSMTLTYSATSFNVREYELANVTVLEALQELVNQIGWNLTWRWDASASAMRLTLWQPARTSTAAQYEFTSDDYYVIPHTSLDLAGIRNACEVVYKDTSQAEQAVTSTGSASIALYGRRFMRIDARGTSVVTSGQATTLADNVVDDLEEPNVQQEIDCAFFWPTELGDLYSFAPNDHYTSSQQYAVFGYQHRLTANEKRTRLRTSGKPSGGYMRWHAQEVNEALALRDAGEVLHVDATERSHTGSTALTTLETFEVPPLSDGGVRAIRVRGVFATSGAAGTKALDITYGGASGFTVTAAAGNVQTTIEMVFQALNANTLKITLVSPSSVWPTTFTSSPFSVDVAQDVEFTVDLADAADTATLQLSEITWMGDV